MDSSTRGSLTIGDLAARSGVPPTTLRSWESRYGFPRPTRRSGGSGHRRYAASDVDAVLEVLQHRRSGLSLAAAVRRVTAEPVASGSVFAELRRRHPAMTPQVLSRRTLVALSHAIEDECSARAAEPLLFGAFQRQAFLRDSYDRWRELARTARAAVVFADFEEPAPLRPGTPIEVGLRPGAQLNREWLVVCDADDLPACLSAVERPGQGSGSARSFEALWSVDPRVVRDASRVAAAIADEHRPEWRSGGATVPDDEPAGVSADLSRASLLFDRMIDYLDARR